MKTRRRLVAVPTLGLVSVLAFTPAALAQSTDGQNNSRESRNSNGTEQSRYHDDYGRYENDRRGQSNSRENSRESRNSNGTEQSRYHDDYGRYEWDAQNDHWNYNDTSGQSDNRENSRESRNSNGTEQSR